MLKHFIIRSALKRLKTFWINTVTNHTKVQKSSTYLSTKYTPPYLEYLHINLIVECYSPRVLFGYVRTLA